VPEWPWIAVASGAWVIALGGHALHGGVLGAWVVMVVAMMVPATLPLAHALSTESLWERRYRTPAIFLAAYVAVWSAFGALALGAWSLVADRVGAGHTAVAVVAILVAGAAWQLTPWQRRSLKRCHRRRPVGVRGRQADLMCARFGGYHARQCVGACWPLMLAMAPAHLPALMVALTALTSWERLARRPNRRACAATLVGLALLTIAV
jgi:predicted metal-binding membrane protein